jgi:excinuclease ABC subunit C
MLQSSLVSEQLRKLPASPGVYLMKDTGGKIIYVGKATSLQNRVRSYFGVGPFTPKTEQMVAKIADIEFVITGSEQEALILEMNLIKRHHPPYNVRLRDDKSFPFLKISVNEDWPRVYFTRRVEDDGGRYFGPFASAYSLRATLKALKSMFPFRTCTKPITGTDLRPCLDYHLKRCTGPCIGTIDRKEYAEIVKQVVLFLEGKDDVVVNQLREKMETAADALDFEKATTLRDQIRAIHNVIEGQRIATMVKGDQDAIAFAQNDDHALAQVFFVRGGKLIGRDSFVVQGTEGETPEQVMTNFVQQFYSSSLYIPPLLLLQYPVDDIVVLRTWLRQRRGTSVEIEVPRRGPKKQLVDTVVVNARQSLEQFRIKRLAATRDMRPALEEIQQELGLPGLPSRIEGYDISNIQGTSAVGSMVVMEEGKPKPAQYRRFRINTIPGADDYGMLQEVLHRRFRRVAVSPPGDSGSNWTIMPDLVLIDGGKGQLNAALSVMKELGLEKLPVAGLAKENEEIFIPGRADSIRLSGNSSGRLLLQHLRDEAHRFALGYHLKVRQKAALTSALDVVPGIGPKRKRALLRKFGSVRGIKQASVEEISRTDGINPALAAKLKEYL